MFPTGLDNLKTKEDDLNVGKLKTVPDSVRKVKWCSMLRSC